MKKSTGMVTSASPQLGKDQAAQERRWRAESDLRTLRDAEQVKADPARVRMAQRIAQEEMRALQKVTGKKR